MPFLRESVVNGKTVNIGRHFVRIVFCFLNLFYSCYSKEACIFKRALPVDTSHPLNLKTSCVSLIKSAFLIASFFSHFFLPLAKAISSLI